MSATPSVLYPVPATSEEIGCFAPGSPGRGLFHAGEWSRLGDKLQLSPREAQIVQHLFDDRREEAIACELRISPHTVSTYVQRLYRKLHVSSRPQLIVRVMAEYLRTTMQTGASSPLTSLSCPDMTDGHLSWQQPGESLY